MITATFTPSISAQDIAEAMEGRENPRLSEAVRTDISGETTDYRRALVLYGVSGATWWLIWLIVGLLTTGPKATTFISVGFGGLVLSGLAVVVRLLRTPSPLSQSTPAEASLAFYENVCRGPGNYLRAYRVLPRSTQYKITVSEFERAWEGVAEPLKSLVATQDTACCSQCGMKGTGLWRLPKGMSASCDGCLVTDEVLRQHPEIAGYFASFGACHHCRAVYCARCFQKLPGWRRKCTVCRTVLGEKYWLLLTKPDVRFSWQMQISFQTLSQESNSIAQILCEVKTVRSECSAPWKGIGDYEELGEKGALTCRFRNTAAKIGPQWYMVAASPGVMSTEGATPLTSPPEREAA